MGFETLAIHAGQEADEATGAISVPIYQTSTYKQDAVGHPRGGYDYARTRNPTRTALEECLAQLDRGNRALTFASGLSAEDSLIRTVCVPGDHIIIPDDAYGGTFRLFARVLTRWGIHFTPAPIGDLDAVRNAFQPRTKMIWCETPTNPLLTIADISGLAAIAHDQGALLAVDNTFASPYLQQPITLGADAVVYSTTKYLGGHSDAVGGAVVLADPELAKEVAFHQNAIGAVPSPFDCWLVLRGIKTLAIRMDRHCANANRIVSLLCEHPRVSRVYYPGLLEHPGHELAAKQMTGFGGMVSFRVKDGEQAALAVCERARLFTLAESLGGVASLIDHPARMTHAPNAGSALEPPPDLVRLSVGIESAEDLLADLSQALS